MKHAEPVVAPGTFADRSPPDHGGRVQSQRPYRQRPARRRALWSVPRTEAPASSVASSDPGEPEEPPRRKALSPLSLLAATFFMVSGGPYGLEEVIVGHGYTRTLLLLVLVPILWSLPVAMMVGELSTALPQEGGYYVWVRRALGRFWGFQAAWLGMAASFFDMAIYPTLFVTYLSRLWPQLGDLTPGKPGWVLGVAMIGACALWNIRGSRAVGIGSTVMGVILLAPFAVLVITALSSLRHGGLAQATAMLSAPAPTKAGGSFLAGILLCMWNYMGWDNASTVAGEVQSPQRTYPRVLLSMVVLVAGCYLLTVLAASASGLPAAQWTTGSWVEVARRLGGPTLALSVVLCGALCGLAMFNVLVMTNSRVPLAMALDGVMPRALAYTDRRTGAPTVAVLVAALLYAACLGLGLQRLVELDVLLYGVMLLLEVVALVVLRLREPRLPRPFRVPGGPLGLAACSVLPVVLLTLAYLSSRGDSGPFGLSAATFSLLVIASGPAAYAAMLWLRRPGLATPPAIAPLR